MNTWREELSGLTNAPPGAAALSTGSTHLAKHRLQTLSGQGPAVADTHVPGGCDAGTSPGRLRGRRGVARGAEAAGPTPVAAQPAMELDPIYCAEQIVVPPDLADILKAYTKEVIRRQPEDLAEFSAIYFANLANVSQGMDEYLPPSLDQLKHIYDGVKDNEVLHTDQLVEQCLDAGISKATVDKVFVLGNMGRDSMVQPAEFLVLLLTMTSESFPAVVQGLFEVFGDNSGTLKTEQLLKLYECLSVWDSDVSEKAVADLKESLAGTSDLTYTALAANELMAQKLAV